MKKQNKKKTIKLVERYLQVLSKRIIADQKEFFKVGNILKEMKKL